MASVTNAAPLFYQYQPEAADSTEAALSEARQNLHGRLMKYNLLYRSCPDNAGRTASRVAADEARTHVILPADDYRLSTTQIIFFDR